MNCVDEPAGGVAHHAGGVIPAGPSVPLESRTIAALLRSGAQRWPSRPALSAGTVRLDYSALLEVVRRRAHTVSTWGVCARDPLALMMDNHLDHVTTWLGATYAGRVQVQINTAYRGRLLSAALNRVPVTTIVVDQAYVGQLAEVVTDLPHLRRAVVRGGDGDALAAQGLEVVDLIDAPASTTDLAAVEADASRVGPGDAYGIIFTSGTTGPSKAVVLPHGLPFGYVSPEHTAMVAHDDVVLVPFPQFHISGQWTGVLAPLLVGGSAVLVERFSVTEFWEDVRRHRITQTTLLSAMVPFLLSQPERADDAATTLAKVVMAPITESGQQFAARFGVQLATCYGQTEACLPIVSWYGTTQPGTCGWVRDDFEVRIVDNDDCEVADGQVGELIVRAKEPHMAMSAYAGNDQATVEKWRNLWLHTGDLHRRDSDGRHSFVDRSVDAIRRRGENISSMEVEAELLAIEGIALAAVIGVDVDGGEQDVKACLVLNAGSAVPMEVLHAEMRQRLPYFMVPRFLEVYDDLPRTPTQRIQKATLRAEIGGPDQWDAREHGLEARRQQ